MKAHELIKELAKHPDWNVNVSSTAEGSFTVAIGPLEEVKELDLGDHSEWELFAPNGVS